MKTSLLYNSDRLGAVGERTLYDLSLDRVFLGICPDTEKRAYFLSVLEKPLRSIEDIGYRRAILADFQKDRTLFSAIERIFAAFSQLRTESIDEKKDRVRLTKRPWGMSAGTALLNTLKTSALTLERVLKLTEELFTCLENRGALSQGLLSVKEAARRICRSSSFEEAVQFCRDIQNRSASGAIDLQIGLDEKGYISSSALIDRRYIHYTDPDLKQKKSLFRRREEEKEYPFAVLDAQDRSFSGLSEHAPGSLTAKVQALTQQLFEDFCGYDRECAFYEAALLYLDALEKMKVGYTFPAPSDRYSVKGLYDLLLLSEMPCADHIVPHDLTLQKQQGALLFGENGSGKTVFLRSFGAAQVLFQAGLPIPAIEAEMPVCRSILSQFSSSEKENAPESGAGRFECEVRELAAVADRVRAGDLVLLNETFQTTAYAEGAEGLAAFLAYLLRGKVFFFAVSHLTELKKLVSSDAVFLLQSGENYTAKPIGE